MIFEEAQRVFLEKHIPGIDDIYICRPEGVSGCMSSNTVDPEDFEVGSFLRPLRGETNNETR